jgi:hypothetical protein
LKSRRVRIREARADDHPYPQSYLRSMEQEVAAVGFAPVYARALLAYAPDELVAVEFEPDEAYDQTPGSKAGSPLVSAP